MSNFCFDVETLDTESKSVILSASIVKFDFYDPTKHKEEPDLNAYYDTLLSSALTVKFNVHEQIKMKRTIDPATGEWWKKQGELVRKFSLIPSEFDISASQGIMLLRDYILRFGTNKNIIWIRGSLDQLSIDSLAKSAGVDPISPFWTYRDIRTAVDLLASNPDKNGYCKMKYDFDMDKHIRHMPNHDIAFDVLLLNFMETE